MSGLHALVVGIDVGTTSMKAIGIDPMTGEIVTSAKAATRWDVDARGQTQTDIDRFADDAIGVLVEAVERIPLVPVLGIGITGMAETGSVINEHGRAVTPAMAWYDQRGKDQLAALPTEFAQEFSATTGLAYKSECSFSKLLWLRDEGFEMRPGYTWTNALEHVAYRLTGVRATEPSLASRTGLLDQDAIAPWSMTLDLIGAHPGFLPPMTPAGTAVGHVHELAPARLRGAAVTVAGHDHLVGAVGAGASGVDDLYNSCGTADVVLRTVPRALTRQERLQLVTRGLSAGRHVLPDASAILGATRAGLVLGRIFSVLGITDLAERSKLADEWSEHATHDDLVLVEEPGNWTNEVTIRLREAATPADLWIAAMSYVLSQTNGLLDSITAVAGPYESATAAGGWSRLEGVLRGKATLMPGLSASPIAEPGARGAALFAAAAAGIETATWAVHTDPAHITDEESF